MGNRNYPVMCERGGCTNRFWPPDKGRMPKYCSDACKQKAYRNRQLFKKMDEHREWLMAKMAGLEGKKQ